MPVVRALSETFLPFAHAKFPAITKADVEERLLEYFPLEDASQYANLRRALVYFNAVGLAPHAAAPIANAERELLEAAATQYAEREVEQRIESDRQAFDALAFSSPAFVELGAEERARYVHAWATSALVTKRRFYRSTKSIIMIAAFSLEASWRAFGYEGPLLRKS